MSMRVLGLMAALLLVSACASEPDATKTSTGEGSGRTSQTSGTTSPSVSAPRPGSAEEFITIGDRVFFDFDKSAVRSDGAQTLNAQAAWLQKYPGVSVVVEGHCDERGTREYNLALGERRANAVKEYLVSRGISANRVSTISYGKERPAVLGSNESAWAQNRRGVTVVKAGAS